MNIIPNKTIISIKKATIDNTQEILNIYLDARILLKKSGSDQWQNNYPNIDTIKSDIEKEDLYIALIDDMIIGVAYISKDIEKSYHTIDGDWLNDQPYLVIHRLTTKEGYYNIGVASSLFSYAERLALSLHIKNIRVDTHHKNLPMQALLKKLNYQYCGIINLALPAPYESSRLAYQKIL